MVDVDNTVDLQELGILKSAGFPARESLADQLVVLLKRHIVSNDLSDGAELPAERRLAELIGVSRTVVREALYRLAAEGILRRGPGRKLVVADFDRAVVNDELGISDQAPSAIRSHMELREVLEIGALPFVVARVSDDDIEELRRLANAYYDAQMAGVSPIQHDIDFHTLLLRAAANPLVDNLSSIIETHVRGFLISTPTRLLLRPDEDAQRMLDEHLAIVHALDARDLAGAIAAMQAHLSVYRRSVTD